jgi:DNA-binding phage protein
MSPTPIEQSEAELAALGERLRKHDAEGAAIDRDLADATERARAARLSMDEIADRAGVARSTLYNALKRAKNRAAAKSRPGTRRSKHPKS